MIRAISGLAIAGALLAGILTAAAPALAQPVGNYAVTGDGYTGTVIVTQTGQTYSVVWTVGNQRFTGIGIFLNGTLSVGYTGEGHTGIALYREGQGGAWEGPYAFVGDNRTQTERWTRGGGGANAPSTAPPGGGGTPPAAGATGK
jgi:hypothetical protein